MNRNQVSYQTELHRSGIGLTLFVSQLGYFTNAFLGAFESAQLRYWAATRYATYVNAFLSESLIKRMNGLRRIENNDRDARIARLYHFGEL